MSDNARMVLMEWVEESSKFKVQSSKLDEKKEEQEVEKKPEIETKKKKNIPTKKSPTARKSQEVKKEKAK